MFKMYGVLKGRANLYAKVLPCEVKYHKAWSSLQTLFLQKHTFAFEIYDPFPEVPNSVLHLIVNINLLLDS